MGRIGSTWPRGGPAAHGQQVQRPLQGVGEGEQGLEAAGGGESGGVQQGLLEAPLGQRGPKGGCAADTWEAEDGLNGSGGFLYFTREAGGACVVDTSIVINPRAVCVLIRESVYMKMRQLLSRNISVYLQLPQIHHILPIVLAILFPKLQRRPLPSILYLTFFYELTIFSSNT